MMRLHKFIYLSLISFLAVFCGAALSLECYQCSTPFDIRCSDLLIHDETLHPTNCNDIYGAEYCIKTTGIFGGGLGTKRFCSPLDLGNYCNYIQQPGDELEYRSCVYTCSTDGCNPASVSEPKLFLLLVTISLLLINIALPWFR